MQQLDTIQQVPNFSIIFNKIVRFFGKSSVPTPQPAPFNINIDWSDSDAKQSYNERENQHVSGGYNEAFIVQHCASFDIR